MAMQSEERQTGNYMQSNENDATQKIISNRPFADEDSQRRVATVYVLAEQLQKKTKSKTKNRIANAFGTELIK